MIPRLLLLGSCLAASCGKVPILPVNAGFELADASWFEEEDTLFFFWEVRADQGIGEPSLIQVAWDTDTARVEWTPLEDFEMVHTHLEVDCGPNTHCGSASIRVPDEPRNVRMRLLYHRDGALALEPAPVFNAVGAGPPNTNRSLAIYGVFDEPNRRVQWRARHQFPTVRNMRATELGLRRAFTVAGQSYGVVESLDNGPYGYGEDCDGRFTEAGLAERSTDERAIFDEADLPIESATANVACATSTVTDANGAFTTGAFALKNPEVRSSFPVLRSPVEPATELRFFLAPCERDFSEIHEAMQRQRLFVDDADQVPTTCTEGWREDAWVDRLVVQFQDAIEAERPNGRDMVLVVGLHQDEDRVAEAVEDAIERVVPPERQRNTPRVAGAFVYDSDSRGLRARGLKQTTLWCPATLRVDQIPDASARSCAAVPDIPGLNLGPFQVGTLPILPTRRQYENFVEDFSVGTAGRATELTYLAPEFATTAEHIDIGDFGSASFLNGETFPAEPTDAFSFCAQEEPLPVVLRSTLMSDPDVQAAVAQACEEGLVPESICLVAEAGLLPPEALPEWHAFFGETQYGVGLFWEFPFLLRMQYEASVAGSISAFGLSVPFGIANPAEGFFGAQAWNQDSFDLSPALSQCTRFCDFPTFDSAGVYQVNAPFRDTYGQACYNPAFPEPGDSGFPLDP